jgi:signal transduction histidine kinase
MGLYACKKIITLHEGSIRVSSRVGRGTMFRIAFDAV